MILLLLAASLALEAPHDDRCRAALHLLYDGSTDTALAELAALSREHPDDALPRYLETLALVWKVEQHPESRALDPELQQRIDRLIADTSVRLAVDPQDARTRLARSGAYGVRSRLHLFRMEARPAAEASVLMRQDLLRVHRQDPEQRDVRFGLGLYDYYVDVLPRPLKLLRLLAGLPGGNRKRGLAWIEEAKAGSLFHETEARAQLFDIHVYWDPQPDRALAEIRQLRRQYPGSPLWGLRLADHLRSELGLWAESAAVAREIIDAASRRHPNYAPVVAQMAQADLGEALFLDLRLDAARESLLAIRPVAEACELFGRAQYLLGKISEMQDDRAAAQRYYTLAERSVDQSVRRAGADARRHPLSPERIRAWQTIGAARRYRETGQDIEATGCYRAALGLWPDCDEATLRVAEAELGAGDLLAARRRVESLLKGERTDPPWVRAWARLARARLRDLAGERGAALSEYKQVFEEPFGQDDLRDLAASGIERPYVSPFGPDASRARFKH